MSRDRLSLTMTAFVAALLFAASASEGQVRRPPPGVRPPVGEQPPADNPANAPAQESDSQAQAGEEEQGPQVDPERIAQMVEFAGPMALLEQEAIRKELKISDEQLVRLQQVDETLSERRDQVLDQLREQARAAREALGGRGGTNRGGGAGFFGAPGFGGPPGGFDRNSMREISQQLREESNKALASVLSPKQRERLDQILLRAKGPMAVTEPEIMDRLNLAPTQRQQILMIKEQLEQLQDQAGDMRRQVFRSAWENRDENNNDDQGNRRRTPGGDAQQGEAQQANADRNQADSDDDDDDDRGRRGRGRFEIDDATRARLEQLSEQSEQLEQRALAEIARVLTRRQKDRFNNMLGEPFDFSQLDLRRMGRNMWRGGRGRGRGR